MVLNCVSFAVQVTSCFIYPHTILEWFICLLHIFHIVGSMEMSGTWGLVSASRSSWYTQWVRHGGSDSSWYITGRRGRSQLLLPAGVIREGSMEEVALGCLGAWERDWILQSEDREDFQWDSLYSFRKTGNWGLVGRPAGGPEDAQGSERRLPATGEQAGSWKDGRTLSGLGNKQQEAARKPLFLTKSKSSGIKSKLA